MLHSTQRDAFVFECAIATCVWAARSLGHPALGLDNQHIKELMQICDMSMWYTDANI